MMKSQLFENRKFPACKCSVCGRWHRCPMDCGKHADHIISTGCLCRRCEIKINNIGLKVWWSE